MYNVRIIKHAWISPWQSRVWSGICAWNKQVLAMVFHFMMKVLESLTQLTFSGKVARASLKITIQFITLWLWYSELSRVSDPSSGLKSPIRPISHPPALVTLKQAGLRTARCIPSLLFCSFNDSTQVVDACVSECFHVVHTYICEKAVLGSRRASSPMTIEWNHRLWSPSIHSSHWSTFLRACPWRVRPWFWER